MNKIKKLIKEALLNHKHDCGCGCHGKCAKAPMLNENLGAKVIMTENMQYHIDNKKALTENTFRYGSKAFLDLWAEARYLYSRDAINLSGEDKIIIETTHLGEYGLFEGEMVPLDLPIIEEIDEAISDEIKVGDIVGNTVQGFNFKVLNIKGDKLEVENIKTGKKFETYIDNMYLPVMEEVDEAISGADKDEIFALISKVKQQGKLSDDAQRVLMQWMSHPDASKEAIVKVLKQLTGTVNEAEYSFNVGDKVGMKHAENDDEYRNKYEVMSIGSDGMVDLRNVETGQPTKKRASELSKNIDEAKEGKHVLNKPRRGGSKKFYVYVRNPKTKKIKKVSFGDTSGLSAKINNPEARRAFSKRHDCPNKTDKTKASYWSCRLPRYAKALGLKSNFTGFW
jgi:ssDNA-binding Zn-finger/Zn-ribbon topoisomerase 1